MASGIELSVGHRLAPCTTEVIAVKVLCEGTVSGVVFVDTPGFDSDNTGKTERDILDMIERWLKKKSVVSFWPKTCH